MRSTGDPSIKHQALFSDHEHGYNSSFAVVVDYLSVGLDHLVPVLVDDYVRPAVILRYDIVVYAPIQRDFDHGIQTMCLDSVKEVVVDLVVIPKPRQIRTLGLNCYLFPGAVRVQ